MSNDDKVDSVTRRLLGELIIGDRVRTPTGSVAKVIGFPSALTVRVQYPRELPNGNYAILTVLRTKVSLC